MANDVIHKKQCPICKVGEWDIKHLNNNPACKMYASCSCGGQIRLPYRQEVFLSDGGKDERNATEEPKAKKRSAKRNVTPDKKIEEHNTTLRNVTPKPADEASKDKGFGFFGGE